MPPLRSVITNTVHGHEAVDQETFSLSPGYAYNRLHRLRSDHSLPCDYESLTIFAFAGPG